VTKSSKHNKKHKEKLGKKPGKPGGGRKKPDHIDETVEQKLDHCPDCGHPLSQICITKLSYFWIETEAGSAGEQPDQSLPREGGGMNR